MKTATGRMSIAACESWSSTTSPSVEPISSLGSSRRKAHYTPVASHGFCYLCSSTRAMEPRVQRSSTGRCSFEMRVAGVQGNAARTPHVSDVGNGNVTWYTYASLRRHDEKCHQ